MAAEEKFIDISVRFCVINFYAALKSGGKIWKNHFNLRNSDHLLQTRYQEELVQGNIQDVKEVFHLLGGVEGVRVLANRLYDIMEELPDAHKIRAMHPANLEQTRENLTLFLCGWLGGPSLYIEKYGSVNLTELHRRYNIGIEERDMWLFCMEKALEQHGISDRLKTSLIDRFRIPAEKIRATCERQFQGIPIY